MPPSDKGPIHGGRAEQQTDGHGLEVEKLGRIVVRAIGGDLPGGNLGLASPTRGVFSQDVMNIVKTDRPNTGLGIRKKEGQGADLELDPSVAIAAIA